MVIQKLLTIEIIGNERANALFAYLMVCEDTSCARDHRKSLH
jgi:hypothetical protein